ncbi:MAG TPA: radical SAM protein [Candidatus Lokiarchaeia archaeon]|nr:radical SAM protein [Candidatus Lokiarchaeia archaeon]
MDAIRNIDLYDNALYIEPVSACNLNCRMCYTNKVNGHNTKLLSKESIISFVERYERYFGHEKFTLSWCGTGEIFLYKDFTWLVNYFNQAYDGRVSHIVTTNGTIDKIDEIESLENAEFYVSIDGLKDQHEWNRGKNTYDRSISFCQKVVDHGCRAIYVRTIVTRDNLDYLLEFERELKELIGERVTLSLLMPYSSEVLSMFGTSNMVARKLDDSRILSPKETKDLIVERYGNHFEIEDYPIYLSICVNYDGVFACCEGEIKLGSIDSDMGEIVTGLSDAKSKCMECPSFKFCSSLW